MALKIQNDLLKIYEPNLQAIEQIDGP